MKRAIVISAAVLTLGFAASNAARAAPLTLDISPAQVYQQTLNSPCVIGDPSCNNPAGFGSTTLAGGSTFVDVPSPMYTVGQIRGIVGNTFFVGIDVNTTTHPQATEILDSFRLDIAGVTAFSYTGPQQLNTNNNGNGYSDANLSGFDLSSFLATASAQFFVSYHNATDGREEFFLATNDVPHFPVPEPASAALLALGAFTANWFRRKRPAALV
jgi:hypothetical protein